MSLSLAFTPFITLPHKTYLNSVRILTGPTRRYPSTTVVIRSAKEDSDHLPATPAKPRRKNELSITTSTAAVYLTIAAGAFGFSWLAKKAPASNGLSIGFINPNLEPKEMPILFIQRPLFFLWETFKEAITVYTGLSPATFFTVLALGLAVYYVISGMFGSSDTHHQRPRSFEEQMQPLPPPVQLGEVTEEELKQYDGSDPKKPLLMAIKGQIYDVSQSRMFYGPGGPYALFAGKDASRALAKMSFEDKDLTGDISGLGPFELEALQDWEYKFMSKYVKVGTIKKPVPVTDEATSASEPAENKEVDDTKPAEDGPTADVAKPTEGPSADVAKSTEGPSADVAKPTERSSADVAEAKE
ncbi:membrane steroid-binding protein 2 isoform X1 [Ricinus communis]|uniref:membrane steroid-binding protein 2 isoform X1 n=1 Tax=Ricinus communis TaxID=3988 RepID=UPI00201A9AB9|nr:membrane steroid-binding protein 2 isoform X1 [Ricinus communis]